MKTYRIGTLMTLTLLCVTTSYSALVQSALAYGSGSTVSASLGSSVGVGDAIIVCTQSTVGNAVSISDSLGNGYAPVAFPVAGVKVWYAINSPSGSNTITATFSSSAAWSEIIVSEFPASQTNGGIDQIAYNSGTGASPSIPINTTAANQLVIGYLAGAQGTTTAGSSATLIQGGDIVEYEEPLAAGGTTMDFTQTGSSWNGVALSFRAPLSAAEQIVNDMTGSHEDNPQGVPSGYAWYSAPQGPYSVPSGDEAVPPTNCSTTYPCPWEAVTTWGSVYPGSAGNASTNTQVNIRNVQLYSLVGGVWQPLQSANGLSDIGFQESPEDFVSGPYYTVQTGITNTQSDGTIAAIAGECFPSGTLSTSCSPGSTLYNFHFWPLSRATYTSTSQGIIACLEARLIPISGAAADDRATANYLVEAGADWYPTLTGSIPSSYNGSTPAVFIGKFKHVQANWRSFCGTNMSLSQLQSNTPLPVTFNGILP